MTATIDAAPARTCEVSFCAEPHDCGTPCTAIRCTSCFEVRALTDTCPKCRWIFGAVPTAFQCDCGRWYCAAHGYEAVSRANAFAYADAWAGPDRPEAYRVYDAIESITCGYGWHVPAKTIAVAVGRFIAEGWHSIGFCDPAEAVDHYLGYLRMPWCRTSGLRDLTDDEYEEMKRVAVAIATRGANR